MEKISLLCSRRSRLRRQSGYLLLELFFSLLLCGVALVALLKTTGGALAGISRTREQLQLEEARRHLTLQLEKTLGYDAVQITIKSNKISCVSLHGNKKYLIYWEKQKVLQKTTTNAGSGVNPLSLENIQLQSWKAEASGAKQADISFVLCNKTTQLPVRQRIYCYNAEVIGDE